MVDEEIFNELLKYYKEIFPEQIIDEIINKSDLSPNADSIKKWTGKTQINGLSWVDFYQKYLPCKKRKDSTCTNIEHQEFPGWHGPIAEKTIIVIGMEISPVDSDGFHIAYHSKKDNELDENIGKKLNKIIANFKQRAYITDIAKCLCADNANKGNIKKVCREKCFPNLQKELELLFKIHQSWVIILQGDQVFTEFKKQGLIKDFYSYRTSIKSDKDSEKKSKNIRKYNLFKTGRLVIDGTSNPFPFIMFPHLSRQNEYLWNHIIENWNIYHHNLIRLMELVSIPNPDDILFKN